MTQTLRLQKMLHPLILSDIKKLVSAILDKSVPQTKKEHYLGVIHTHFQKLTQITGFETKIAYLAAIPTAKGKALGLNHAAQCLLDHKRTIKFLDAIIQAIQEKQRTYPDECITLFYAGCGPYAPLMTLVAPFFDPKEVQFSVLEINKYSLESAKKLINSLELSAYIKEYYLADAVTFQVPNATAFHILISETLDALLYRECYVPILFNLLPQFDKNTTLIPKNVQISLSLSTNKVAITRNKEVVLATIMDVQETILTYPDHRNTPAHLPDKKIDLTSLDIDKYDAFLLDTKVHIYNDIWLYRNESSLTLPMTLPLVHPFQKKSIIFTYYIAYDIGLKCRFE